LESQLAQSYRDLRVWQLGMDLVAAVYNATDRFPKQQQFGLTAQLQRAAVSVPSNIAEGKGRQTDRDYVSFLYRARGSLLEVETQIQIAQRLSYLSVEHTANLLGKCEQLGRSLQALIESLEKAIEREEQQAKTAARGKSAP
jgi:four helix bundle protein